MGIPKFFRYISERWPMISQLIEGNQIPEFDNLYLDMNSILHNCTHGNDMDLTKSRLTEEEVFAKIFTYIDHLFMTIKPKKIFYMAIDGVAPRAKMNQQRARRFRSAMDAEIALQKAINNGDELPKGEPFDSNAITPGTEFMAKLTKNLKYFIHNKISNDSNWSNVKIIFSGHEVPGEGEHKIMNFIRNLRSNTSDYNNNTRHCIYGLDADLIMLSLSTHAPHFALLREEVTFGRSSKQPKTLEQQNFYLLHISLLREYMELEFIDIADNLKFEYNFDKILDDFILIMFVIGNDFLPNLPDLHLNKGAFPVILQTFKEALLHLDGYINDNGTINLQRLKIWLEYLSQFELMNFEKDDIDVEWFNKQLENISIEGERKRNRMGKKLILKQQKKIVGFVKSWIQKISQDFIPMTNMDDSMIPELELSTDLINEENFNENEDFLKTLAYDLGLFITHSTSKKTYSLRLDVDGINPNETEEQRNERIANIRKTIKRYQQSVLVEDIEELENEKSIYNKRFVDWKNDYYKDKLKFNDNETDENIVQMTENYVEGLQWVLYYYYRGCPSWSWYYKFHYAPRISDLEKGLNQIIKFDQSKPFKPYEQLMSVLPERSKNLIPTALRPLMFEETSPIIDFYPSTVELDMNGKTADWEAVVLLPFVDENRLFEAMKPILPKLSPEEKQRNEFACDLNFVFNPQVDNVYKSPLSGIFSDIENDHCVEKEFHLPQLNVEDIVYGILPNAKQGAEMLAGFPSLKTIPFSNKLEYNETQVFQQPSRQQSVCLYIDDIYKENNLTIEELAKRYLGKVVYTRWPYLRESKLISIFDEKNIFEGSEYVNSKGKKHFKIQRKAADVQDQKTFFSLKKSQMKNFSKSKAVMLDDIRTFVKVLPVLGIVRKEDGAYVKNFAESPEFFPLQLMVENITNVDERYKERAPIPIEEEFPVDSHVVFLGDYAYGGETIINGYTSEKKLKITVNKKINKASFTIGDQMKKKDANLVRFFPSFHVARELHLNRLFLAKITSRFLIVDNTGSRINVGISVKFDAKREKVLGYARKNVKGWEYSNLTMNLLLEYKQRFPEFFQNLSKLTSDMPKLKELFPNLSDKEATTALNEIKQWIKFVTGSFVTVSFESDSFTKGSIQEIEEYIINHSVEIESSESKKLAKVPREAILNPRESFGLLRTQKFNLGDRIVYIQDSGKVPLFSKGTVVGYTTLGLNLSVQVLFDREIVSGNTFGGRLRTKRGLGLDSSLLLNVSNAQFIYHSKASKKVTTQRNSTNKKNNFAKEQSKLVNQKKANEAAKVRKEAAHDLLNIIKKEDGKIIGNESENNSKTDNASLINHTEIVNAKKNDSILPEKAVANSVFNAVLHQFDSNDNTIKSGNQLNGNVPINGVALDPTSLPYDIPTAHMVHPPHDHPNVYAHGHMNMPHPQPNMPYPMNMNMNIPLSNGNYAYASPNGMPLPNGMVPVPPNLINNPSLISTNGNVVYHHTKVNKKDSKHLKSLLKKNNSDKHKDGKKKTGADTKVTSGKKKIQIMKRDSSKPAALNKGEVNEDTIVNDKEVKDENKKVKETKVKENQVENIKLEENKPDEIKPEESTLDAVKVEEKIVEETTLDEQKVEEKSENVKTE